MLQDIQSKFLHSALTQDNPFISTSGLLEWLEERRQTIAMAVEKIDFDRLHKWSFDATRSRLHHETGSFFSIDGISVETNWGSVTQWDQPIINQPEIGYLGIIAREHEGVLYFLMQAKIEPGNINLVQIGPTLQATRSNYMRVHLGRGQRFLHYFQDPSKYPVLIDQLQSEQGARFLKKRNRNVIVMVQEDIQPDNNYQWMTLGQIKNLMQYGNTLNMDSRTVVSGIPFSINPSDLALSLNSLHLGRDNLSPTRRGMLNSFLSSSDDPHSIDEILTWFTTEKLRYDLDVRPKSLSALKDWTIKSDCIEHHQQKYFRVIPVSVAIEGREVQSWCQPMVEPMQSGLIGFIVKKVEDRYYFLVQAKLECGNFDVLEFAPTVQCLTGNYRTATQELPFLATFLNAPKSSILYDQMQSEEGGRFYREQNRNMIVEVDDSFSTSSHRNFRWMSLNQLQLFLKFNNYLNVQCRGLIAAIEFR